MIGVYKTKDSALVTFETKVCGYRINEEVRSRPGTTPEKLAEKMAEIRVMREELAEKGKVGYEVLHDCMLDETNIEP